jgi:hypothetical protein
MSIANVVQLQCQYCGTNAVGGTNKRFCSDLCRSRFNNRKTAANRKLVELVNTRAIAYAQNVNLLKQLILDNRLGPHTLNDLVSLGYCAESPFDDKISHEEYQVTLYGNIRLKKYFGMDRYVLCVEGGEKSIRRKVSYTMKR